MERWWFILNRKVVGPASTLGGYDMLQRANTGLSPYYPNRRFGELPSSPNRQLMMGLRSSRPMKLWLTGSTISSDTDWPD
jgi:hypothetical protein